MAGLLNSTKQPAAAPQPGQPPTDQQQGAGMPQGEITSADQAADNLDDPLLKQAEQQIDAAVPQEHRAMYDSIVVAGMNVMFSKQTSQLIEQQLAEGGDLANNVSDGVAKLVMIVFNESGQSADQFAPAAALACVPLLCQALDYAEQVHGAQVTPEVIAQCTKQTQIKVLKSFGITEDQLNQVAAAGAQQGGGAAPAGPGGGGLLASQPVGA